MNINKNKATIYDYTRLCKYKNSCDKCPLDYENTGEFVSCRHLLYRMSWKYWSTDIIIKIK